MEGIDKFTTHGGPEWLELGAAADHQLAVRPRVPLAKQKISTEHAEGEEYQNVLGEKIKLNVSSEGLLRTKPL